MHQKLNRTIIKGITFLMLFLITTTHLFSFPHRGDVYHLTQPDGSKVTVLVYGDEYYQDIEGLDGYTLIRDPGTGWICYAVLSTDGNEYVSTGNVYTLYEPAKEKDAVTIESIIKDKNKLPFSQHLRINKESMGKKAKEKLTILNQSGDTEQTPRATPGSSQSAETETRALAGTIRGLTLLIDFPDLRTTISRSQVDNFCNQTGYSENGNNGSIKDWFYDVSNNQLIYENIVTDFFTVSKNKSYYDADCEYCRVTELVHEALNLLKNSGFNFSNLSTKNGYFTAINVLYYGEPSQGWARGLWPHSGRLNGSFSVNGIAARPYQLTNLGTGFNLRIGTIVHENGHMVCGWDDLYAYDDHDSGIGYWDAGRDNRNPAIPNPYFLHLLDWINIVNLNTAQPGTIFTHTANSRSAFMYTGGNNERFYIEARRLTGRNANLPGEGLTIWHVYENGDNKYSGYTHLVSLEQADGRFDLENKSNSGDSNDTFRAGYKDRFSNSTSPNSNWYTGASSGVDINTISGVAADMNFTFGIGDPQTPVPTTVPTPSPTPNQEPIWSGGPYSLSGTSDYVDLPDGLTNDLNDFSIACWINLNSLDTWSRIFDFGGDTNVFMMLTPASGNTGYPYFTITLTGNAGEQGIDGTSALPTGSWQHLAVVKSGNTGILYINTQEVGRNTGISLNPADMGNTVNNYIGRSQWSQDPYLNADIDGFVVYNRGISASEVTALGSTPPGETGILGDTNDDGMVDIVDALLIAQYYVGLIPSVFIPENADTNCDENIDIVDALLVAQYYVGLITGFC